MKKFYAMLVTVVLAFAIMAMPSTAYAEETCVPKDAWTETVEVPAVTEEVTETVVVKEAYDEEVFDYWQRYSWTGGPHEPDTAPSAVPPHDDWQANTKSDPHNIGVAGPYFVSHGNSGNGDWFYLEAVTKTVKHPAVTKEVTKTVVVEPARTETVEHDAVVCVPDECVGENGEDLCVHEEPEPPVRETPDTTYTEDGKKYELAPWTPAKNVSQTATLPNTGAGKWILLTVLAGLLIVTGTYLVRRKP